eukprot:CAMPEP_0172599062 /NCGR_PEP_ID=MMETSP1068-20121228/19154_1 /TAXON_ID=35684 /ORGANISM="Pseudopedinella elastica, Strain CCMP716" /LENGTH=747 /DNA_ID=CAMNT_0013399195 /DNA_START=167 /DNA_END=2406 /DNA_ORIENTATION=+
MRRRGSRFMSWKRTKSPSPEAIEETSATASTSSTSSAQEAPPAPETETETETETESPPPDPPPPPNTMAGDDSDRLSKVEKTLDKVVGMLDILMNQPQQQQRHDSDSPTVSKPDSPKRHGSTRITSGPHGGDHHHHHHHRSGDQKDEELLLDDDASWEGSAAGASKKGSFLEGDPNSDNEDSVKVIDTDAIEKKAVLNESDAWKINPKNKFRMGWDLFLIMPFLIYMTIAMPFRLCFANDPIIFTPMYWFEFMIDMIFIVDIFLNFRTGYFLDRDVGGSEEHELIEFDSFRIAINYIKTWFVLDVVSGVPFALLELISGNDSEGGALKSAKSLKLLRFLKLGRLLKMEKILSNLDRDILDYIEDFFANGATRTVVLMCQLGFYLGYVCHLLCCGFVLVGRDSVLKGDPSWFDFDLRGPYVAEDTTAHSESVGSIYLSSFYFCLTTMTSVGYGDITPRNNGERTYVIVVEFVGAIVFGMIIASLTSVVSTMDSNARKTAEQLDAVASFVEQRKFPEGLGRRIRRHFRHFYSLKSAVDEVKIFGELSTALRKEVSSFLVKEAMGSDSFFVMMPQVLWPRLLPMLRPMRFEKDEVVCMQGEECTEMYVVLAGTLRGENHVRGEPKDTPRHRHVMNGGTVNVLCCLKVWSYCVETVTATVPVESYAVTAKDFVSLFTSETDLASFRHMQIRECQNFKMDTSDTRSEFGRPVYFSCFSTVELTLVQARGLLYEDGVAAAAGRQPSVRNLNTG